MPDTIPAGQRITAERWNSRAPVLKNYTAINANTSTTTTTEVTAITTPSLTFETGRAYRITYKGLVNSSVSGDTVRLRVHLTDNAGITCIDSMNSGVAPINGNGGNGLFNFDNIVTNTTGADITEPLIGTYNRQSGSGNVLIAASATHAAYLEVWDVGPASDFPGATALS
ncbi:hypothetical protein AB0903_27400 [Streptomyces sp. NPDC048389]|uniref:hypothetical protein n=1 Tax=Streptomyces sp. NPDC048389 TaxID=3154622 RepID=UPI00345265BA